MATDNAGNLRPEIGDAVVLFVDGEDAACGQITAINHVLASVWLDWGEDADAEPLSRLRPLTARERRHTLTPSARWAIDG